MSNVTFTIDQVLELMKAGLSGREVARTLGKESQESTVRNMIKREKEARGVATVEELLAGVEAPESSFTEDEQDFLERVRAKNLGAKIFLGDVEVSTTLAHTFGRFKAFISPKHVVTEPYMLTFAGKWLHNPAIFSRKLPDYPEEFAKNHRSDRKLVEDLWHILDECDIFIAHNARFDRGWANQRFAFYGMQPPSPYVVIDTLAALKEAFSLPSNALEAACNYFELESRKRSHEGITLWIRCYDGEVEAFEEMEEYNIGDIPTLEELYLTCRPFMKKHPNVALYHPDQETMRCVRCGSSNLLAQPGKVGTTYLSAFSIYRCGDCGSNSRDRRNLRSKGAMALTLANVI